MPRPGTPSPADLRVPGPPPAATPCDPTRTRPLPLHDALDEVAALVPDQRVHFPDEDAVLTLAELAAASRRVAGGLAAHGVGPGDRVGLLAPNAPEFLTTLFGCSRLGAATAPLALPMTADVVEWFTRLRRVLDAAGPAAVVVSHRLADRLAPALGGLGDVPVLDTADLDTVGLDAVPVTPVPVRPDAAAIVQFTSGSTADPKGVVLTHGNVWHCARAITAAIALDADDVHGSWLPLFHDMGLFGALTGLFRGIPVHLWSPAGFVRRPARWLAAFAQVGATIGTMPNFGYDTLVGAVDEATAATLDLSAWRVAFNGAEAVSADATDAFLARFAAAGFRPATMTPAYGLAEATLVVTLPPRGRPPVVVHVDRDALAAAGTARPVPADDPRARPIVGLGRAVPGLALRTAAPDGGSCPDDVVGEIQVQGPTVTAGYLRGPAPLTADGWLRTGDLGFLREGELFFTGRVKELIAVGGRNVYPADVEEAARPVAGVHRGRCVAFADTDATGAERVALVVEAAAPDEPALLARVRVAVARAVGAVPLTVHAVAPRTIPRTTSGKLRRLEMRARLRSTPNPSEVTT
ncbi:AMP-binding protein [Actinomycetospora chiangmaiensis]|uniref:AMP-binding protein n=1 Tax=Actinomycetospora chiangmaiensis TaxID=402650 RepID=UPI000375767F|nr:AMP-binding protein [Actinomycetospora chiangmaiensis]